MDKRTIFHICWPFIWLMLFYACQKQERVLYVATAANMQFAMQEMIETFSKKTGIPCEPIMGSSGKLTAQVKSGAPYDVFVSADMKYPLDLYRSGLGLHEPEVYAHGSLVLWSNVQGLEPSMEQFQATHVKHIALANPQHAPYGMAALQLIQNHQLMEKVKDKLVYGESIAQTNQFILSQAAQIGFTSKSVVLSPHMQGQGQWAELRREEYEPIEQGILLLKNGKLEWAKQFYQFVFSNDGKEILEKYGYHMHSPGTYTHTNVNPGNKID